MAKQKCVENSFVDFQKCPIDAWEHIWRHFAHVNFTLFELYGRDTSDKLKQSTEHHADCVLSSAPCRHFRSIQSTAYNLNANSMRATERETHCMCVRVCVCVRFACVRVCSNYRAKKQWR